MQKAILDVLQKKLSLSRNQLNHLINELSSRNELYWLNRMWKFPLSVGQCKNLPVYRYISEFVHLMKPRFSRGLQIWLSLYFTEIFSDGFESGDFSAWTGSFADSDCSATVQSSVKHHGNYAAQFSFGGTGAKQAGAYKDHSGYTTIFSRIYVRFTRLPDTGTVYAFMSHRKISSSVDYFSIENIGGTVYWGLHYRDAGTYYSTTSATPAINADQWYCLEGKAVIHASSGEYRMYVDGAEILSVTGVDSTHIASVSRTQVGYYTSDGSEAPTFYVDRVVVADTYIGPEIPVPVIIHHLKTQGIM